MFCPNCGNNCGDARFCTACGTQVQKVEVQKQPKEAQEKVWTEGMPCPYCGGMQIENGKCMFCGVQLTAHRVQPVKEENRLLDIPCGVYNGVNSSLTLHETECVVRTTLFFVKKYETRIPYNKIRSVVYVRPTANAVALGYLVFRWEGNESIPISEGNTFSSDKSTITTSEDKDKDTLFYHIFYMLKAVAPASAEFRVIAPAIDLPGLEDLAAKTNLEKYFYEFAPYRQKAVEALRQRTGATKKEATELINRVFDAKQKETYERDPKAAIHDLNLYLNNKKKQEEQAAKERRERMEKAKRDALLYELEKQNR